MPRQESDTLYSVHLCYGKDHMYLVTEVSSKKTLQTKTQNVLSETTIDTRPHRKAHSHPESCTGSLWSLEESVWLLGWRRVERTKEKDVNASCWVNFKLYIPKQFPECWRQLYLQRNSNVLFQGKRLSTLLLEKISNQISFVISIPLCFFTSPYSSFLPLLIHLQ